PIGARTTRSSRGGPAMTRLKLATADTFRSLQHRNYRLFFYGQAVSFTGTWLQLIAQTLLVLRLTDSGTALGLLTAIQFAPTLVLGAWAGVVIDRHDKRRLMTVTTSAMLLAALTLGLLVLTDQAALWSVYALAGVLGLANTFDNPARRSLVNDLVPADEVGNAVGLTSTLVTGAKLIGPAIAGILVATVGIGWCFIVNALSFVAVLVALWQMDPDSLRSSPPLRRAKGQLRDGLRYAWSVDDVRTPLLLIAVVGTLSFNFQVLFPLLAQRELGGTETTYTVITTIFSVGSVAGSLALARRRALDTAFLGRMAVLLGLASLGLAVAPSVLTVGLVGVVAGYAGIGVLSGSNAVIQLTTAPEMRGRMMALFAVVFLGSTPIGGPISGWMAEAYGTRSGFVLGAVAALAAGTWVLVPRVRATAEVEQPPGQPVASPVALQSGGAS
ncbi:MAG: MFS transporter, partial [Acidimicrobiales bacterium]